MEILKTSEALESQILEDARKKATRILETAEKECAEIREEWERKLEEDTRRMAADLDRGIADLRHKLGTSLPLDFMRRRLAFIQDSVAGALRELLDGMPPMELARIVGLQLRRASTLLADAKIVVFCSGMAAEDARKLVCEHLPAMTIDDVKPLAIDATGAAPDKGIVIETTDGRMRYRGTLSEVTALLMGEYREELMTALLGKDV